MSRGIRSRERRAGGAPDRPDPVRASGVPPGKFVPGKIRVIAGALLIGLGLVGMLVPVLPGIPLLVAGGALLGANHPWVRPFLARFRLWRRKRTRAANRGKPDASDSRHGGAPGR